MNIVEGWVLFLDAKYKSHNIIHDRQNNMMQMPTNSHIRKSKLI